MNSKLFSSVNSFDRPYGRNVRLLNKTHCKHSNLTLNLNKHSKSEPKLTLIIWTTTLEVEGRMHCPARLCAEPLGSYDLLFIWKICSGEKNTPSNIERNYFYKFLPNSLHTSGLVRFFFRLLRFHAYRKYSQVRSSYRFFVSVTNGKQTYFFRRFFFKFLSMSEPTTHIKLLHIERLSYGWYLFWIFTRVVSSLILWSAFELPKNTYFCQFWRNSWIRVITKLPNSEQSYKGKVKTHKYINRQNQSTTGKLWKP